ncbi:MAG: hypothetical protein R3344_01925 [Acidobacteriota bacterium]|nr:hypothetical protein [Acidobacteriota bacterium]
MDTRLRAVASLYILGLVGVFLVAVPWTPIWDRATLAFVPTALGGVVRSGWFRGAVCGLGALDLLAAAEEAGELWRSLKSTTS